MRYSAVSRTGSTRSPGMRFALVALLGFGIGLTLALAPLPAHAAEFDAIRTAPQTATASDRRSFGQKLQAAYWRGRTCSTPACKAAQPSSVSHVASFALAAFGGVWISRRRAS